MDTPHVLSRARRRAGLTQRELAERAGVAQPAVARIESGAVQPRVDTFERLLAACGQELAVAPRLGDGIDCTGIRALLRLSPGDRARLAVEEARNVQRAIQSSRSTRNGHRDQGR